jgi:hypothetical protein
LSAATPGPVSSTAAAAGGALAPLPGSPAVPQPLPSAGWEDFTAVTLVSMPFTAFWAVLGALIVGGVSQGHFPPEVDTPMLAGAAAVAGGASLGIGLVSLHWGPRRAAAPDPAPAVTPVPAKP